MGWRDKHSPATMSTDELLAYARDEYGVELDADAKKNELLAQLRIVRRIQAAGPAGNARDEGAEAEPVEPLTADQQRAALSPDRPRVARARPTAIVETADTEFDDEEPIDGRFRLVKQRHPDGGLSWDVLEPHPELRGKWVTMYRGADASDDAKEAAREHLYGLKFLRRQQMQEA